MSVYEKMTAIADKIRSYLPTGDLMTLDDMPARIDEAVFNESDSMYWDGWDAGYDNGYASGYDEGYSYGHSDGYDSGYDQGVDEGKQAEYDRFWDAYQDYGDRNSYAYAFAGQAWTDEAYNPKYPINATGNANALFNNNAQITDTKVPINLGTKTLNKANMFEYATNLVTIRELTWDCDIKFAKQFTGCKNLKNITFNGTITRDINMQWCPLTVESAFSVLNHLMDFDEADRDKYTITFSAAVWEALDAWGNPNANDMFNGYETAKEYAQSIGWLTA